MKHHLTIGAALAFLLLTAAPLAQLSAAQAEKPALELASLFVDGAVLQRGLEVPVWGWAAPGSKVTVEFAGQSKTGATDGQGKWMVKLDPLTASTEERGMTVTDGNGGDITRKGLLVGEVWLASGQSNMDWLAGKSLCAALAKTMAVSKEEIPIREYEVDAGSALFPCSRASSKDGWKSSKSAGEFSALALSFAWDLHQELKVPVGIIRCSHGATQIETWTAYEGFAGQPQLNDIAARIRSSNPTSQEGIEAFAKFNDDLKTWQLESETLVKRGGAPLPRPPLPGICDDWKGASRMYNKKIAPLIPYAIRGAIWCQGEHNSADGRIYADKMHALVNGWRTNWARPDLPFYFTQMQCYGDAAPDSVGFADIREAQTLFFMNAKNVGMVPQHDFNPDPKPIHYSNKLDAGKRLARWALAHEYGKDIPYTGPIYQSSGIEGGKVRVRFEQRGPGGGLMVGSKGMQIDAQKNPDSYVEPAKETPGAPLKQFRLAGKDKVWHEAEAVIEGGEVVVSSKDVPEPLGVRYAYCASPIGANLYNKAGLPAIPFAYYDGKQYFPGGGSAVEAAADDVAEAADKQETKAYLIPSTLLRPHAVIQRDLPVPIWGHGVPATEITVTFGDQKKTTKVGEFRQWSVTLDAMPFSSKGRDLGISCSNGEKKTVEDVVVGDVWVMTGSNELTGEIIKVKPGEKSGLEALPLVREFRIKTKTRRFETPRKLKMEIGGGKYESSWQTADFDDEANTPSVAAYHFAAKVQEPGVPVGIITLGAENPPLTWVSYAAMQTAAGFEKERDELNLAHPETDACKTAITRYIEAVKQYNLTVAASLKGGREVPAELADKAPQFPQPYYNQWASRTGTATHTYNFCISPLTPLAVRGVVWIPGKENISDDVLKYTPSLQLYAASLAGTYGQEKVPFVYAHPGAKLVAGVTTPQIENSVSVGFDEWPKSLREIATKLAAAVKK